MLSDEVIDKVVERLVNRIEQGNEYVLEQIGKKIKQIGNMTPTQAQQLIQVLKYGGDYEKIVKKLAEITKLNVQDIHKIFKEIAKNDLNFAKQFYNYRRQKFIPYAENLALKRQVEALAQLTSRKYAEIARTSALGYTIRNEKGKIIFKGLKEVYDEAIDKAVLAVTQGKSTFQEQMYSLIKNIGISGLKTLDYENGRTLRLDSAIRMHMDDAIRQLHNETQEQIGKEFDSDGVEITVHLNPAPDHQEVQGKQFSNEEFYKFQNDMDSYSYDGTFFPKEHNGHDRRSISQYNCKHYTFAIILGVNIPQYSDKQLKEIINRNNKGFDYDGKHYSMYEGTQLQRKIETEIRKQKDIQIMAKASGKEFLAGETQNKITILNKKYKELSEISGLPTKMDRMRVSEYKRSANSTKTYQNEINKMKVGSFDISKYTNEIKPTTSDVILTPKQEYHIRKSHPEIYEHLGKLSNIINNPDNVYMELNRKRKNTIWLTKEIADHNFKVTIKINTTSAVKELGYKNSVIQMQILPKERIQRKIDKGDIKALFDIKNKK